MDVLCNYQGYKKCTLILVFDAYKVEGGPGSVMKYHNIHVVYTKEAETLDSILKRQSAGSGRNHHVTVATSDALEQVIILGHGAARMSALGIERGSGACAFGNFEENILEKQKMTETICLII